MMVAVGLVIQHGKHLQKAHLMMAVGHVIQLGHVCRISGGDLGGIWGLGGTKQN